jgi:hypothetical protein
VAPAARWIARNGGSVILVLLGASLLGASFFRSDDAPYALGLLIFGSSLVTVGVVLPRLRNAEVGPATGFKLTLDEQRALSTELAEAPAVTPVKVDQVVTATRLVLASEVLGRLLAPEEGPLAGAWFHLYLYDEQRELLLPAFEGQPSPSQGWKPGVGAVGEAWVSGEYVLARGPEVSDDTYGLTPDQQHRARNLALVAAMPVSNASDEVIAVLAASSVDTDSALGTSDGFDAHLLVAQEVARVLIDLLQWFAD